MRSSNDLAQLTRRSLLSIFSCVSPQSIGVFGRIRKYQMVRRFFCVAIVSIFLIFPSTAVRIAQSFVSHVPRLHLIRPSAIQSSSSSAEPTQIPLGSSSEEDYLNVTAIPEYTCSGAQFGFNPNSDSCIEAIRLLDARDDKQRTWRQRGSRRSYDVGLPQTYWSCTSRKL